MTTTLDKLLKRQITVDGADYTVSLDADGVRLTGKGKRKPEVDLRWRDLLSGDAAMAVALNASLAARANTGAAAAPAPSPAPSSASPPEPSKPHGRSPAKKSRRPA